MSSILPIDLHTHTAASGHGTTQTIADLAKSAAKKGMTALGVSDHGPATPGSCREAYFRSLKLAPGKRCGISVYYGAEANILDETGVLDLSPETLSGLDYCIASIHQPSYRPRSRYHFSAGTEPLSGDYTSVYINAMKNPYVKILGHVDDPRFPVDMERLLQAAMEYRVLPEINEASLAPGGYRGNARPITLHMLSLCKKFRYPVLLSSDSHGAADIGETPLSHELLEEIHFPAELVINLGPVEEILGFRTCFSG